MNDDGEDGVLPELVRGQGNACWSAADRARVLAEVSEGLWRYAAAHAAAMPAVAQALADLTGLSSEALETLRHLHLLLSDEVRAFVESGLPALLARPRPVAPPRPVTGHGPVRGRIAWSATTAARARRGSCAPTLNVTATPLRHYSTPETRLLARLLPGLLHCCRSLHMGDSRVAWSWGALATGIETAALRALADPILGGVEAVSDPATDLAACRRSPRAAVRLLAHAYTRYHDLVEQPTVLALLEALRQRVLAPLDDDTLYEVWALLGATAALDDAGWRLEAAELIGRHATPFAYRSPDGRAVARLRFGHTPAHWRRQSRYRAVFERYSLAGATRRPDLIVDIQQGHHRRYLLVEVKRTCDPGYIADSIYKVLGYLADFESAFGAQRGTRGLLLLWDGITPAASVTPAASAASTAPATSATTMHATAAAPDPLILATHRDYQAALHQWLIAAAPIMA